MRPIVAVSVLLVCVTFAMVRPSAQGAPQAPAPRAEEQRTLMIIGLNNVYKDSEEDAGHGEGDSLTVIIRGETAVGGLSELEGSQQDPSPICMTGTFRNGFLHLQSHPEDFSYDAAQITIRGKLYPLAHGHAFHGRIAGGPFHSEPTSASPHFPSVVTLRAPHDEYDSDQAADSLANDSCACEWKKHAAAKDFVTANCAATEKK